MMMLLGIIVAVMAGSWQYARHATLVAIITGGFVGEVWHRWRSGS